MCVFSCASKQPKSKKKHRDDLAQKLYESIRDVDLVQRYLVSRATLSWVNTADGDNTCLHRACILGPKATVAKMLVDAKADIHATNAKGQTPLHCACQKGWLDIAKLLVDAKVNERARSFFFLQVVIRDCVRF